jgi:flagellar basal body-associated protein FliL
MAPLRKSLVVALALAIAFSSLVFIARPVAAAQNRPTWAQGDFWVYARTEGTTTSTIRFDVLEKTTLTLTLGTYDVWHVTITTTPSGGSATVQHSWVRDSDLGIAKANFTVLGSDVQVTFDPPLVLAQFPLAVNAQWSLSTTVRVVDTGFNFNLPYSATVTAEQSTTVTAGTFNVAVVRSPSTGTARDENHYSESAGNSVRQDSYDSNGNRVAEQELTSHRYQSGSLFFILLLVAVLVVAAVAVGVFVALRRRRRGAQPAMLPPPPPLGP